MAKARVHIWHAADGQIIAIGHAPANSARKVIPLAGEGQFVLEIEVEEAHVANLPRTHIVDVHKKTLVEAGHRLE
jgi:hypothetical protein